MIAIWKDNPLFSSVKLNENGLDAVKSIRIAFTKLMDILEDVLPGNSREISIIKTKLEEASFYAVKAVRNYRGNVPYSPDSPKETEEGRNLINGGGDK
jgi:hypothetical protein